MAKRLHFIRHGAVRSACAGRFIGSTDLPLSARGRRQIADLGVYLKDLTGDRFLVSPLARTRESAAALFPDADWQVEPDLREIDFGEWETLSFSEIAAAAPAKVQQWNDFDPGFAFPNGESLRDFHKRIKQMAEHLAAMSGDSLWVVTHGGVIRSLICYFLGLSLQKYLLFQVEPASLTTISLFSGGGILNRLSARPQPTAKREGD